MTLFKTPVHILDGIAVKRNRDSVKDISKQTSFKTMGKSGIEDASQDTVEKVSTKLIPFKTPDVKYSTSRLHFKTFDKWVKARKMKCDTALKDALSFVSEKKEEDQPGARHAPMNPTPAAESPTASRPRALVTLRHPECPPYTEERPPWNAVEESSPWNQVEHPPSNRGERQQATWPEMGNIQSKSLMTAPPFENISK